MSSRFAVAKDRIVGSLESVIAELFGANAKPRHRRPGGWNVVNPWRPGAKADQMYIWLRGARRGAWKDFVSGDRGDAIDLVAFALAGIVHAESRMKAVEWAEDRFGIRRMDKAARERLEREAAARRQRLEEEERQSRHRQRERVRKFYFSCDARILGSPVDAYLASRGIRLADVPNMTPALRHCAECEYWPLAQLDGEGRRISPGPTFPAMVAAMVSGDGRLGACHLTFLAPNGSGKAPVKRRDPALNEKLFKGDVSGLVIRLTNGPSGLSAEQAAQAGIAGPCGVTEGIEDALSAAVAEPSLRMWAAGSLSSMLYVPDHPAVSGWILFRDNDWGKPQAADLFSRVLSRFRSFRKPVEVVAMPADWGKDVNDAINL